jgi:heat shock protein HtpX
MKRSDSFALYFLLSLPMLALAALGWRVGGVRFGILIGALAAITEIILLYKADVRLLKRFNAREITQDKLAIVDSVRKTARIAGIPTPKLYLCPSKAPNAFTVGITPDSAAIVVTEGLLETLSKEEQEGVVGHEIAHIVNSDVALATILATLTNSVSFIAGSSGFAGRYNSQTATRRNERHAFIGILSTLAAPIGAAMIQMAVSREREFIADRIGAGFNVRYDELAGALEKMHQSVERIDHDNYPHLAHLFVYASFRRKFFSGLFSTHPPVNERVARLRELALTGGGVESVY